METIQQIRSILQKLKEESPPPKGKFFKMEPGHYGAHDQFMGVSVPNLRKLAKDSQKLPLKDIGSLFESPFNEERQLALLILTDQYNKGSAEEKSQIYEFYLKNLKYVNNWNLVDASAHLIMGAHLFEREKHILLTLSRSENLWERRIAIVSTWYFIRKNQHEWTLKISEILLKDTHDLIHKAVGWMLREMGKKDQSVLVKFLDKHAPQMPRTMLRYGIEKFPEEERKGYLLKK